MKKRLTRIISFFLVMVLVFVSSSVVYAADSSQTSFIEKIAYMDIDRASLLDKAKIIEAREELIYNETWVADGFTAYIADSNGNVIENVPEFSDLFPSEWTVGITENINNVDIADDIEVDASPSSAYSDPPPSIAGNYIDTVRLRVPSEVKLTSCFRTLKTTRDEGEYKYHMTIINSGTMPGSFYDYTYNLGYTNMNSGLSLLHARNLPFGQSFVLKTIPKNITLGIRASSYNIGGDHQFQTRTLWMK